MNRRKNLIVGIATLFLVVIVIGIFYSASNYSNNTVSGWVVTQNLVAGTSLTNADVQKVQFKEVDTFSFISGSVSPVGDVLAYPVSKGDLLRPDEMLKKNSYAQVSIQVMDSPTLANGDYVDLYTLNPQSNTVTLVASQVLILSAGPPITIEVPVADSPAWAARASQSFVAIIVPGGNKTAAGTYCSSSNTCPSSTMLPSLSPTATP